MKQFIITEEQVQKLANLTANIPTIQGMPIIDILRSLPELPIKNIIDEFKEELVEGK